MWPLNEVLLVYYREHDTRSTTYLKVLGPTHNYNTQTHFGVLLATYRHVIKEISCPILSVICTQPPPVLASSRVSGGEAVNDAWVFEAARAEESFAGNYRAVHLLTS